MELIFIFIFGLLIGSFLNVCIYRVPREKSVISPCRSYCPSCENQLLWWENIPVISWCFLRGKCKNCKKEISSQYALVEIVSGLGALASFIYFGLTPTGVLVYFFVASLIVITFIDLEFRIIPNVISFPGMTFGLLLGIFNQYTNFFTEPLTNSAMDSLLGFLAGGGFFYLISLFYYLATKRIGLGGGDVKLMAMVGAILGVESIAETIFFGSIFGSFVGIAVMYIKGTGRQTEIPFGPWLSLGALMYLFGNIRLFSF